MRRSILSLFLVSASLSADPLSFGLPISVQVELQQRSADEDRIHVVAAGDISGDGKVDLVVNSYSLGSAAQPGFAQTVLLVGNGDGTFQPPQLIGSTTSPGIVLLADVNGDGAKDVIVEDSVDGGFTVFLNNGHGSTWTPTVYSQIVNFSGGIAVADFNGDGKPDVLVANFNGVPQAFVMMLNRGDGTFQPATPAEPPLSASQGVISSVAMDLDGDGYTDIVVQMGNSSIVAYYGRAGGAFEESRTISSTGVYGFTVADFNGDGRSDIAFSDLRTLDWLASLGNRDFTFPQMIGTASGAFSFHGVAAADVNGDRILDLVTVDSFSNSVRIHLGTSGGGFDAGHNFPAGVETVLAAKTADLNGDGKPDLIVAGHDANTIAVQLNTSTTTPRRTRAVHH